MNDKKQMGQKKLKKILLVLVIGFIIVGGVSAAYIFGVSSSKITGQIINGDTEALILTQDFQDFILNVSDSDQVNSQNFTFYNPNGWASMNVDFNVTTLELDNNCNSDGDITIELLNSTGSIINNGDNVSITSGTTQYTLVTSAVKKSCPVNITTQLKLIQVN